MIRNKATTVFTDAKHVSPVRHKQLCLSMDSIDIYHYTVSGTTSLDTKTSTEGDMVFVPDPLPQTWWDDSAADLRRCQREVCLLPTKLVHTHNNTLEAIPAVSEEHRSMTRPTTRHMSTSDSSAPSTPDGAISEPTVPQVAPLRTFVLDSGSAHHIQNKTELSPTENDLIETGQDHILETANGDRLVNEHSKIRIPQIGLRSSHALALDDCPSLLSVGQLVEVDGFRQVWDPELGYCRILTDIGTAFQSKIAFRQLTSRSSRRYHRLRYFLPVLPRDALHQCGLPAATQACFQLTKFTMLTLTVCLRAQRPTHPVHRRNVFYRVAHYRPLW